MFGRYVEGLDEKHHMLKLVLPLLEARLRNLNQTIEEKMDRALDLER